MEETGWKLVHGDVFRPPQNKQLLSALLGAGVQIFFMSLITIGKTGQKIIVWFRLPNLPLPSGAKSPTQYVI